MLAAAFLVAVFLLAGSAGPLFARDRLMIGTTFVLDNENNPLDPYDVTELGFPFIQLIDVHEGNETCTLFYDTVMATYQIERGGLLYTFVGVVAAASMQESEQRKQEIVDLAEKFRKLLK